MRLWNWLVIGLLLAAGCMHDQMQVGEPNNWSRFKPLAPDMTPDVVELHYIFIDREEGDALLSETIWKDADEQAIPLEMKQVLNDNGIRVGRIGTKLSPELRKLVDESKSQARRHHTHSGRLAKIQLTDVLPNWNLFSVIDGRPRGDELKDAQGYLYVTPTIGENASTALTIQPEIEYGPMIHKRIPSPDLSGWQVRNQRESRSFPELRLDVKIESGEFLLLGTFEDKGDTLGQKLFTRDSVGKRRQVALLVRVLRPSREELFDQGYQFDDFLTLEAGDVADPSSSPAREAAMIGNRTMRSR